MGHPRIQWVTSLCTLTWSLKKYRQIIHPIALILWMIDRGSAAVLFNNCYEVYPKPSEINFNYGSVKEWSIFFMFDVCVTEPSGNVYQICNCTWYTFWSYRCTILVTEWVWPRDFLKTQLDIFYRGGSRGVHREQVHPLSKKNVLKDRDTLIEQSL